MPLLPVNHIPQQRAGECLAACAAMVLEYLSVPVEYSALVAQLRLHPRIGGPFRNLRHLESLGVKVLIEQGEIDLLRSYVEAGSFEQEEALVADLHRLGVRHLARRQTSQLYPPLASVDLVVSLSKQSEACLHSALILLFLRKPSFTVHVPQALAQPDGISANRLRLYDQAAVYLQHELESQIRPHVEGIMSPGSFCFK